MDTSKPIIHNQDKINTYILKLVFSHNNIINTSSYFHPDVGYHVCASTYQNLLRHNSFLNWKSDNCDTPTFNGGAYIYGSIEDFLKAYSWDTPAYSYQLEHVKKNVKYFEEQLEWA